MPEVEDQRRAVRGAWVSMTLQVVCFQVVDSGPCSWIMWAFWTADSRVEASFRRLR